MNVKCETFDQGTITSQRINTLLDGHSNLSYLEIGVDQGSTFNSVRLDLKIGVDPSPSPLMSNDRRIRRCESDTYFADLDRDDGDFDVIFIDGLHTADQLLKDLVNSIVRLKSGGIIILDDVYPDSRPSMCRSIFRYRMLRIFDRLRTTRRAAVGWQGDVCRAIPFLQEIAPILKYFTVVSGGEKLQTFVYLAGRIDTQALDHERIFKEFKRAKHGQKLDFYGRQPSSKSEVPDYFRPVSWEEALDILASREPIL